jgi:hypothetical protein
MPVSQVKAIIARLRRSSTVLDGLRWSTFSICSGVGTGLSFEARAALASFSDNRK